MDDSHRSLADDFEVSTPELDGMVASLRARPGVHGARITGAGFGGCVVVLADPGAFPAQPQPDDGVTYAAKIDKAEARLDFAAAAIQVERQIRAFATVATGRRNMHHRTALPGRQRVEIDQGWGEGHGSSLRKINLVIIKANANGLYLQETLALYALLGQNRKRNDNDSH